MKTIEEIIGGTHISVDDIDNYYEDLYEYFTTNGEMPYGTAKARTGDPYNWIFERLDDLGYII